MAWHTQSTRHTTARKSGTPKVKPLIKKNCKHLDGWILLTKFDNYENPIIIIKQHMNEDFVAEFMCNSLHCSEIKKFKFDIKNIEEVDTDD